MGTRRSIKISVAIDTSSPEPVYRQIYRSITNAMLSGSLPAGSRMPSVRELADDLGVSRTTVDQAYTQLITEGVIYSKPRSGTFVSEITPGLLSRTVQREDKPLEERPLELDSQTFAIEAAMGSQAQFDFSYANLVPGSFPIKVWRRLVNDVLDHPDFSAISRYADTFGDPGLRSVLGQYLSRARGVSCDPSQFFYAPGSSLAFDAVAEVFDPARHVVAIEEPGYPAAIEAFRRRGYTIVPLRSNEGTEAYLHDLHTSGAKVVFATPSHQFPTGKLMNLKMRLELLAWAEENNAFIIEDDCCYEYRYDSDYVPSLQSLDTQGRVIYTNTMSKCLSPSLRIAFFIMPRRLMRRYLANRVYGVMSFPYIEAAVFKRFIQEGYLEQHIRRVAHENKARHNALVESLENVFGRRVTYTGAQTGMHLYVTLDCDRPQQEMLDRARAVGVNVYGDRLMWFSRPNPKCCFLMGFSSMQPDRIREGVKVLGKAWLS